MTPLLPGNEELTAGKAQAALRPREGPTGKRRSPQLLWEGEIRPWGGGLSNPSGFSVAHPP